VCSLAVQFAVLCRGPLVFELVLALATSSQGSAGR
jgi:hypothetical protein